MASAKKGITVSSPQWWKHLRQAVKRQFWKRQRRADKAATKADSEPSAKAARGKAV